MVILNADDDAVAAMAEQTAARVVRVSRSPGADVWAGPSRSTRWPGPASRCMPPASRPTISLAVHGDHQVSNALCAAAVALECGATGAQVAAALAGAGPVSQHRMHVTTRGDGVTVIDDAYNANPDSMLAGLKSLAWMARQGSETGAAGRCSARWPSSATTRYRNMTASAGWQCD